MKRFLPGFLLLLLTSILPAGKLAAQPATTAADDVITVGNRLVRAVIPSNPAAQQKLLSLAAAQTAALGPDGHWTDIDYSDGSRSVWPAAQHLNRLLVMAKAARLERDAGHPDTALEAKLLLALHGWTSHDYTNPNWWWNEIGGPELLGETALVMGAQLPPAERDIVLARMRRSNWRTWTGANLVWGTGIQIVRGCLEGDAETVRQAYARMYEEIRIVGPRGEGVEADASFHQHGMQLYNGGYGLTFSNDIGRFLAYAWGTSFQIPADKLAIFDGFLLDGQQWMIRGRIFDYSAVGREITRKGKAAVPDDPTVGPVTPTGSPYGLASVTAQLAANGIPRHEEMATFAARLAGKPGTPELTGNRMFWCSDFIAHRRAGYATSVRVLSNRMLNSELVNSEGRKSVHMSDGANFLYLTGLEYRNVFGVWDWTKVPGTTALEDTLVTGEKDPIHTLGTTTFDGGVSDGMYGMAAMDLARGNLTAKKAWFFFDREYVALGTDIHLAQDSEHAVATAVNQPELDGPVLTSESSAPVAGAQHYEAAHPVWIHHHNVGYIFAPQTAVRLTAGPQTGAWADSGTGSATPETVNVFNLWIDHGKAPAQASYAYTVVPAATAEETARLAAHPEVEVLANGASQQAVYQRTLQMAQIVFRTAGALKTPLGVVTVDHPCLLLVQKTPRGIKVTASNPENQPLTLSVQVNQRRTKIELPDGNLAGSSVTALLR